ncbi:MAG: YgeY family selenium metabolism-linked hydrolase [bacterium]|nr:YgeY family selenium metabolism-linked hydrolase [bacterium]
METKARNILPDAINFLRTIILTPSLSGEEEEVARKIARQMVSLDYDEVSIDSFGSVIGRIGNGPRKIMYDAHIDTVGIGDPEAWAHDPYCGKQEDGWVWGRGASDNKGGLVSILYGASLAKRNLPEDVTLYVVGSAMEEDCDGIAFKTIIGENNIRPDVVLLSECTDLDVYRGHRGRMEIKVITRGESCHASAPERGCNAIYKMTRIIEGIEALNDKLKDDPFLGKGTVAVTKVTGSGPSLNAVPDLCEIFMDRRLTAGETRESALQEIRDIVEATGIEADVEVLVHEAKGWTGKEVKMEKYYPTWTLPEDHASVQAGVAAAEEALGHRPAVSRWTFSTNGVYTAGLEGIPSLGFGPALEAYTHSVDDRVSEEDMLRAIMFYALYPKHYSRG